MNKPATLSPARISLKSMKVHAGSEPDYMLVIDGQIVASSKDMSAMSEERRRRQAGFIALRMTYEYGEYPPGQQIAPPLREKSA